MQLFFQARCPNPQKLIAETEGIYWSPVKQSDITWNYEKILIDHEGKPYKRYVPLINPKNSQVIDDIEYLLSRKKSADEAVASETKKTMKKPVLSDSITKKLQKEADEYAAAKLASLRKTMKKH